MPTTRHGAAFRPRPPFRIRPDLVGIALSLSAGAAVALFGVFVHTGHLTAIAQLEVRPTHAFDLWAIAFLVGAGYPSLHHFLERRRRLTMEARLPDFLGDLASLHKAGLTLPDSLVTASTGSYGPLTREVAMAADQVRWNVPILTVLENLRKRIGTPIAERSLTVVVEAGRSGGNVPEVLEVTAKNTQAFVHMREQRRTTMSMYTIIAYVASLVFIGVTLSLQHVFVPRLAEAFGAAGHGGAGIGFAPLPHADEFRSLFYMAALVMSFGNGLVGGIMSEGRAVGGLKHAWVMVLLAFIGFTLL